MRRHTEIGERIVMAAPSLAHSADLVRSSHERYDGHGYPDHLAGEDIPIGATIIAVCDAFHAMISTRPYSDRIAVIDALAELRRCSGSQFDPRVVPAFCELVDRAPDGTAASRLAAGRDLPKDRRRRRSQPDASGWPAQASRRLPSDSQSVPSILLPAA